MRLLRALWKLRHGLLGLAVPLSAAFLLTGLPAAGAGGANVEGWIPFTANWSASGQRQVLKMGSREVSSVHVSGALVVTSGEGLSRGFRAEALGFDDGAGTSIAKMVLTDDKNDQIFLDVKGRSVETAQRFTGSITGGSGRYEGIEGDLSFQWQFVVLDAEGMFQGRAVDLKGRYRRTPPGTPAEVRP